MLLVSSGFLVPPSFVGFVSLLEEERSFVRLLTFLLSCFSPLCLLLVLQSRGALGQGGDELGRLPRRVVGFVPVPSFGCYFFLALCFTFFYVYASYDHDLDFSCASFEERERGEKDAPKVERRRAGIQPHPSHFSRSGDEQKRARWISHT